MEMAWRPERSKVACRGPPPSVVRRNRSGSSLRAVEPWPLRYMGQKGKSRKNSYHPRPFTLQASYFFAHGVVTCRHGDKVGNEDRLQLHISIKTGTLKYVGHQMLIGVEFESPLEEVEVEVRFDGRVKIEQLTALGSAIPNSVPRPLV